MKRIATILISLLCLISNAVNAQNKPFNEGVDIVIVASEGVYFYTSKVLKSDNSIRDNAPKHLLESFPTGETIHIEKEIEEGRYIFSYQGNRFVMSVGKAFKKSPDYNAKLIFYNYTELNNLLQYFQSDSFLTEAGESLHSPQISFINSICHFVWIDEGGKEKKLICGPNLFSSVSKDSILVPGGKYCSYSYRPGSGFAWTLSGPVKKLDDILFKMSSVIKEADSFQANDEVEALIQKYKNSSVILSKTISPHFSYKGQQFNAEIIKRWDSSADPSFDHYYPKYTQCKVLDMFPRYYMHEGRLILRCFVLLSNEDSNCPFDIIYPLVGFKDVIMSDREVQEYKRVKEQQAQEEAARKAAAAKLAEALVAKMEAVVDDVFEAQSKGSATSNSSQSTSAKPKSSEPKLKKFDGYTPVMTLFKALPEEYKVLGMFKVIDMYYEVIYRYEGAYYMLSLFEDKGSYGKPERLVSLGNNTWRFAEDTGETFRMTGTALLGYSYGDYASKWERIL